LASESAILSWTLAVPLAGGGVVLAIPASHARRPWIGARAVSLAFAAATLILASMAAGWMDPAGGRQLIQNAPWLASIGIDYEVGATGLSLPLMMLAAGMGAVACWASYGVKQSVRGYFALLLWSIAAALGALALQEPLLAAGATLVLAVVIYFLAAGWGGDRRVPAARRFLYFGVAGMAAVTAGLALQRRGGMPPEWSVWATLAGFGALMAVVPLHVWLGDLLAEATTPVGMVVVCFVQTAAAYGLMQWLQGPLAESHFDEGRVRECLVWIGLGVAAYAALGAMGQRDLMRLAANFSIAQMGFVLMGIAVGPVTMEGAGFMLVAHGLAAGMMVYCCGMIRERVGHCEIERLGGLAGHMPGFAGWSAVGMLGLAGVPGLCGFVGQILVVMGIFGHRNEWGAGGAVPGMERQLALLGAGGVAVMAVLMGVGVWMYQRVYMGAPRPEHSNVARMSLSERWILAVLGAAVIGLGLMPMAVTGMMRGAAGR
jgi:NAD(P)H-quinone oxidoreductase subunit 4